jgi:hypothetical protein
VLGRIHQAGGVFGSGVVRAMLGLFPPSRDDPNRRADGAGDTAGILDADPRVEYALQPFGIPGGQGTFRSAAMQPKPRSARDYALAHEHTLLAIQEASYHTRKTPQASVPESLRAALDDMRTWKAPR